MKSFLLCPFELIICSQRAFWIIIFSRTVTHFHKFMHQTACKPHLNYVSKVSVYNGFVSANNILLNLISTLSCFNTCCSCSVPEKRDWLLNCFSRILYINYAIVLSSVIGVYTKPCLRFVDVQLMQLKPCKYNSENARVILRE